MLAQPRATSITHSTQFRLFMTGGALSRRGSVGDLASDHRKQLYTAWYMWLHIYQLNIFSNIPAEYLLEIWLVSYGTVVYAGFWIFMFYGIIPEANLLMVGLPAGIPCINSGMFMRIWVHGGNCGDGSRMETQTSGLFIKIQWQNQHMAYDLINHIQN